jgi:hypothetical protein
MSAIRTQSVDGKPAVLPGEHVGSRRSVEPKRCKKEMAPSRGRAAVGAAASIVTSAAALSSRSISARKIFMSRRGAGMRPEAGGQPVLMEEYTSMNVKINNGFTDADFDPKNTAYKFGK